MALIRKLVPVKEPSISWFPTGTCFLVPEPTSFRCEPGSRFGSGTGAQWRNGNAAASQQERSGFDSWKGHCGHCVMCPLLHVIGAHTLAGVGDRAFLCGVR